MRRVVRLTGVTVAWAAALGTAPPAVAQPASGAVDTPPGCHWVDVNRQVESLWCRNRSGEFFNTGRTHSSRATVDSTACPAGQTFDGADCVRDRYDSGPVSRPAGGAKPPSYPPPAKPAAAKAPPRPAPVQTVARPIPAPPHLAAPPSPPPKVTPAKAQKTIAQTSPGHYLLYGRGVFDVPPGWTIKKIDKKINNITLTSAHDNQCVISAGLNDENLAVGPLLQKEVHFLMGDWRDDFASKQTGRWKVVASSTSSGIEGDHVREKFFSAVNVHGGLQKSTGQRLEAFLNYRVEMIAHGGVNIAVWCTSLTPAVDPHVSEEMFRAVRIDVSQPRIVLEGRG